MNGIVPTVTGEMHDVVLPRPKQGAKVVYGDWLIDTFLIVRRIDDAWQAFEQSSEAVCDVKALEAAGAGQFPRIAGD